MVSATSVVVGLLLIIVGVILGLIGYDLLRAGAVLLRDAYSAVRGRDTGLHAGYVRTTVTPVDGTEREGPLGTSGHVQQVTFTQRDWTNLFNKRKQVSDALYDSLEYEGAVLEDSTLTRETVTEPTVEMDYNEPTVSFVSPNWSRTERLTDRTDITDDIRNFAAERGFRRTLERSVGALESITVKERSVRNEDIRLIGRFTRDSTNAELEPVGRTVFSDASWRRLAAVLTYKGLGVLGLGAVLAIASLVILGAVGTEVAELVGLL